MYIGPGRRRKSPITRRSLGARHAGRVFIKRGRRADSYDVEARVYLFPREQEEAADIYTAGLLPCRPVRSTGWVREREGSGEQGGRES